MKKKLIQTTVIVLILAFLMIPAINPFLDAAAKEAVSAQLQDTFGGLMGGSGMLTPARLISAATVILLVWLGAFDKPLYYIQSFFGELFMKTLCF
jgi:hypothetical protein